MNISVFSLTGEFMFGSQLDIFHELLVDVNFMF